MKQPKQKPHRAIKGLEPMPPSIIVIRQVIRVASIVIQTGNELIRVAIPIVRAISGRKPGDRR